jgi:hypothetical protein
MGAPSNRTATLESQMIPMIQDVPGQTLRFNSVVVPSKDVVRIWSAGNVSANAGGRPEEYDWDAIKSFTFGLIKTHGTPAKQNKRLPTKQALIDAICDEWGKKDIALSVQTVRTHLNDWLQELGRV